MDEQKTLVMLNEEQVKRKEELKLKLVNSGLTLRDDSDMCWDYIYYGAKAKQINVDYIVLMMARAQYLHQYCNFKLGYKLAQNTAKNNASEGKKSLNYNCWLDLVNRCVLATTRMKKFPDRWPWLEGISKEEWKARHDISSYIVGNRKS